MIRINKLLIAFVCMLTSGFSSACLKPTQKNEAAVAINTKYNKEIADIKMKLCACTQESAEFPFLATQLATLLKKRIEGLTEQLQQAHNPMHTSTLKDIIKADQTLLHNIHQMHLLNDLLQEVTAQPVKLNHESMLTYIATMESILEEQRKLITEGKNNQAIMSLATIDKMLAECNAIKKRIMKAIEKEDQKHQPTQDQKKSNKKSEENLKKLFDVISTNNIKAIQERIKQCIEDNPDFFKQSLQLPKGNMNVLMLMLAHPTKKITKEALKLIAKHSEIHIRSAINDETLSMAILKGNKDHVAVLLEAGACVDVGLDPSDTCLTPFVRALDTGNDEIINMILGKVMMINDIVKKNNHLAAAAEWLQQNPRPNNTRWVKTLVKLGKNLIEKELVTANPELARVVEKYALHKKAQAHVPAQQRNVAAQAKAVPEFKLEATVWTEKNNKQKIKEQKAAFEKEHREAQKEKQREALERAKAKQRESERRAQSRLANASLPAAGAGAGAAKSTEDSTDQEAQEIAKRKALAKEVRIQNKRNPMRGESAAVAAAVARTSLAYNVGNLRNQLNPLLRPHFIKASEPMPKNGRLAPLGIITAYLHNAPCQPSASNSK